MLALGDKAEPGGGRAGEAEVTRRGPFPSAATEHNAYRRASPGGREGLVVQAGDSRGFTALGTVVVCSRGGGFTSALHAHCVRNERVFAVAHVVDWPAARAAGQKHRQ